MNLKKVTLFVFSILLLGVVLGACRPDELEITPVIEQEATLVVPEVTEVEADPPSEIEAEVIESEPVTLESYTTSIASLDPQTGEDVVSLNNIESLFIHLTNYALGSNEIVPEAATDWTISDDGLIYTFNIRTDIPWVKHNPVTGETTQEVDDEGDPRFVTAYDFEFGFKRTCDPSIASYYSSIVAPLIAGCEEMLNSEVALDEEALEAAKAAIGVTALDESTLEVTLAFPASYFLSMTPMWILAASPQWAIEDHGIDKWLDVGRIVTSGRFVLSESVQDVRRTLLRNPLMPADMAGQGNIEKLVTTVVPDIITGYFMWLNNEVDTSGIPDDELETHLEKYPDETAQISDLVVNFISFRESKAPFDDPRVRRAFSAAFDRESFVTNVRQGQGLPMIHFAPPGIFGAPPIDEVGIGYDPEFAREQLAAAGYPNCEGFPRVNFLGFTGQSILDWIEFAQAQWQENLGCRADLIQVEQLSFPELLEATDASVSDEDVPHLWTLGWGPDYPDENNWVGDVLWCGNPGNREKRDCTGADELIVKAREELDPARRIEMYRQIEEMFFGVEGEFPFMPIWVRIAYVAEHDWLSEAPKALFGGQQYYHWTIDRDAKQEARVE